MQIDRDLVIRIKDDPRVKVKKPSLMKEAFSLMDFQHRAVALMAYLKFMVLAYDVGLGKSAITICTYAYLKEKGQVKGKMMVMAPRSAIYQWAEEITKFSNLRPYVLDASNKMTKDKREKFFNEEWENYDVIITTYSIYYRDYVLYKQHIPTTTFVFDEVLVFKNEESKVYKYTKAHVIPFCDRAYGLSATVLKNNMIETYNIFKLFAPSLLPSRDKFFEKHVELKVTQMRLGNKLVNIKTPVDYKEPALFFSYIDPVLISCKKSAVKDRSLPKVVIRPVLIDLNSAQRKSYKQIVSGILEKDTGEVDEYKTVLVKMLRCQQLCDSPSILEMDMESAKEVELLRLLEEDIPLDDKVVIFTKFKTGAYRLKELLAKYNPLMITGDSNPEERDISKKAFTNTNDHRIMIINTAAKEAVNLQTSGFLIFMNLDWSYGDNLQIVGRINRLGSTHEYNRVYILLAKNTIDQYVYASVMKKEGYFTDLLGGVGYKMGHETLRLFAEGFTNYSENNPV